MRNGAIIGMAAGWVGGALFDWTGDYTWSILISVAAGFLGITLALVIKIPVYNVIFDI